MRFTLLYFFIFLLTISCKERTEQQLISYKSYIPCDRVILPNVPYPDSIDSIISTIISNEDSLAQYFSYIIAENHAKRSYKKVIDSNTFLNDTQLIFENYEKGSLISVVTTETDSIFKEWLFTFKDYTLYHYSMDTLKNSTREQCITFFNIAKKTFNNALNMGKIESSKVSDGKTLNRIDQFKHDYYYIPDNSNLYKTILDSMQELIKTRDTPFNTIGTIIARKGKIQPFNNFLLTTLHVSDTVEHIFLCSQNSNLQLIDTYYIGNTSGRNDHLHDIREEIINSNTLRYYHCDMKFKGEEIDTLQFYNKTVSINEQGKFYLTQE